MHTCTRQQHQQSSIQNLKLTQLLSKHEIEVSIVFISSSNCLTSSCTLGISVSPNAYTSENTTASKLHSTNSQGTHIKIIVYQAMAVFLNGWYSTWKVCSHFIFTHTETSNHAKLNLLFNILPSLHWLVRNTMQCVDVADAQIKPKFTSINTGTTYHLYSMHCVVL